VNNASESHLMLKQRIMTAVVLVPLFLIILFYSSAKLFGFLTALLTLGGAWEWSHLMGLQRSLVRLVYCLLIACLLYAVNFIFEFYILLTAFLWWLIAAILIMTYAHTKHWWGKNNFLRGAMGVMVLVPCWTAINLIRLQQEGVYAVLFLFVLIWGADTGAYFVGKKWGKNKLAPLVSPGKSWQGFIGALFFSIVITLIVLTLSRTPFSLWLWAMMLSLVTVIFSVEGDLFESMLKREAGVKDSGQLLPGHGGLLDRIDSLTAAAPIFAFGGWLLGMYGS